MAAALLGVLIALPAGTTKQLSVEIWFVVTVMLITWRLTADLIGAATVHRRAGTDLIGWIRGRNARPLRAGASNLRSLEALLYRLRDNPRPHVRQLRPKLIEIAAHHLTAHHGLDLRTQPEQTQALLGPVAWIIDPTVDDRAPTMDELEMFLDRLEPSHKKRNEAM